MSAAARVSMREVRYTFGRLNVIAEYDNKPSFLRRGLGTDEVIQSRGFGWGFSQIEDLSDDLGDFLTGLLVKYRPEGLEEVFDPATHQLSGEQIENKVAAKARFFLHIRSGLIAYRVVTNAVNESTFRWAFKTLFEAAHHGFFVDVEIQSIDDREDLFQAIRRFQVIRRVSVALTPSNPNSDRIWKETDDRLKAMRASSYREEIQASSAKGLNLDADEETRGKITMAIDGYGKATVAGLVGGHSKVVSTERRPMSAEAPGDDEPVGTILKGLHPTMSEIFERIKN